MYKFHEFSFYSATVSHLMGTEAAAQKSARVQKRTQVTEGQKNELSSQVSDIFCPLSCLFRT